MLTLWVTTSLECDLCGRVAEPAPGGAGIPPGWQIQSEGQSPRLTTTGPLAWGELLPGDILTLGYVAVCPDCDPAAHPCYNPARWVKPTFTIGELARRITDGNELEIRRLLNGAGMDPPLVLDEPNPDETITRAQALRLPCLRAQGLGVFVSRKPAPTRR